MSFSFAAVSFILEGLASGAAVCAEASWNVPATSSTAARQTLVRSIGSSPVLDSLIDR
jgi:hypothetical protein